MTEAFRDRRRTQSVPIGTLVTGTGTADAQRTWYRGQNARRAPGQAAMMTGAAVAEHVLDGWLPPAPRIDRSTHVTAFGSCFAANISRWLGARNYRVSSTDEAAKKAYVVRIGEGLVNSFVLRQQFEWAWEDRRFDRPLWHGPGPGGAALAYDETVREQTRALFDRTDVFVLTLGLSEIWYDASTGDVLWRRLPEPAHDPRRQRFRVSSVEENRRNLDAIYRLIRRHRPGATIILTLSPVPLIATFRDQSCITSSSVSKAVLRVAIDEAMRAHGPDGHLFYWPSYEMVTDVFGSPFKADRRHLPRAVLDFIMIQFEHVWCDPDAAAELAPLDEAYLEALAASRILPARLSRAVRKRRASVLERHAASMQLHDDPGVNAAMQALIAGVVARWAR